MFTAEELEKIDRLFKEGLTPDGVAQDFGINPGAFRHRLKNSGWEIEVTRKLRPITPVVRDPQPTTAHVISAA